jgi:hypothetical protein
MSNGDKRSDNNEPVSGPDAANSYERSRPSEQSPGGKLDQEKPPVLQKPDSQDKQNESPDTPPESWKHDQPKESAKH